MEKVLNKKEYVMDMTEGSSMKLIMKFSVPLLIGNLFQQVYSLVDSIVVGRHLGANALGGVGSVGMISFLFFSLCNGMASGIGVVISRYFGAKKEEQVKKASLTIEAAFALPLFFFGMVTMIHFMDVYRIQTEHLSKLCQSAKEAGMYAYVVGGDGVEEITLPDVYKYKPIGGLIPLPAKWQYNKVRVHAWTGADRGNGNSEENKKPENMVYVTVSGSVYHKKLNCSHLNLSVTKVSG